MATLLAVLLLFGAGFLLCAFLVMIFRAGDLRALRRVRRTPLTPIGSWPGRTGTVAAEAVTEYGPAGRLHAPVSGADCAWFHVEIRRRPSRDRSSDAPESDLLSEHEAPAGPAVADRSGRVPVDPTVFRADPDCPPATERTVLVVRPGETPGKTPGATPGATGRVPATIDPRFVADLRRGEALHLTEVRLDRGREVMVLARMARDGVLRRNRTGRTLLTPGTVAETTSRMRADTRTAGLAAVWFLGIGAALTAGSIGAMATLF